MAPLRKQKIKENNGYNDSRIRRIIMDNYFRITGYDPDKDYCFIIDCFGAYKEIWQFSALLLQHGYKVLEVGDDKKFADGNFTRIDFNPNKLIVRATAKGKPVYENGKVNVHGRFYIPKLNV